MVFEYLGGSFTDFGGRGLSWELFTSEDHVNLKDAGAKIDIGVSQTLEELIKDFGGDFGGFVDVVVAVIDNFGFHNRDESGFLAF